MWFQHDGASPYFGDQTLQLLEEKTYGAIIQGLKFLTKLCGHLWSCMKWFLLMLFISKCSNCMHICGIARGLHLSDLIYL